MTNYERACIIMENYISRISKNKSKIYGYEIAIDYKENSYETEKAWHFSISAKKFLETRNEKDNLCAHHSHYFILKENYTLFSVDTFNRRINYENEAKKIVNGECSYFVRKRKLKEKDFIGTGIKYSKVIH